MDFDDLYDPAEYCGDPEEDEEESYDPTLEETEEVLRERVLPKMLKDKLLTDEQYVCARQSLKQLSAMMFRINAVDNHLNFVDVALMCIYKISGED